MDSGSNPKSILMHHHEKVEPKKPEHSLMPLGEKGLHWDEDTIAEHDKERGGKQKIEEPKTPYNYGSDVRERGLDRGITKKRKT